MLPFLFFLLKIGQGNPTVVLDGDESRASFVYGKSCDLVKPIGRNNDEEVSFFKYYQKQTSRLTVDKNSAAFKIQYPTYREALKWSCCLGLKSGDSISDCHSAERHLIATVPFSPVQIIQVSRFFTRESGSHELVTTLIKADVAKPRVGNIIPAFDLQLVLDADPESCEGITFTRRFTYRVPQRPAHERNSVSFLSFSDDSIPQNCRLTMFLQKPCEQFPDSCRDGKFFYNKYSQVKPTLFDTSFKSEDSNTQVIGKHIITGTKLDVLYPIETATSSALSYHAQGNELFTELPKAAPVILSGLSAVDIFHCEASGYPIPIIELLHPNSDDVLLKPKCERTNWNRKVCRWQITPNQRLLPYARCRAKNELATATQNIQINDHIHRIDYLTPDTQTISVHGISDHVKSNVRLEARLQLASSWAVRQNILTSKIRSTGGLRWRLTKEDMIEEYKQTILNQVQFLKDGSPVSFACGKRIYTVELDDESCLKTEGRCYAFVRLEILLPDVDDSGEYRLSLVNASPDNKYRITRSVRVEITDEPNSFSRGLYAPKTPDGKFSVFELKKCDIVNSESLDCRWWPSFNTSQTTPIYSVHAFDQNICLDELAPYNTTVVNLKDVPIRSPSNQQFVIRDLIPGHSYKVTVCAWQRDEINTFRAESGSLVAVVDGRGQRKCLTWPDAIEMPGDRPKYFIEPPSMVRDALDRTEFAYSMQDIKDLASVDIDRFQVVFTMTDLTRSSRYGQCRKCPKLRFKSQLSEGTVSNAGPVPRGVIIQPFPRGFNDHGFGPYLDEVEPRRDAEEKIESDPTISSYEIQLSQVQIEVIDFPGDYYEVKWSISRKFFKVQEKIVMDYEGGESARKLIDLNNADEKDLSCNLIDDNFRCRIWVPIQADLVSFESIGGTQILSIFLNKQVLHRNAEAVKTSSKTRNLFKPPYLAEVNRNIHSLTLKVIPRMALFHNDYQAIIRPVIFTMNLGLSSYTESADEDGLTFRESIALTSKKDADFSAYVIEYEIRTCAIRSNVDPTPRLATCQKTHFSDLTISITQSFVGEEKYYSPESLRVLIEPDRAGIRQEQAILDYVKTVAPPEVILSPVPSQDLLAIFDVSSGRRLAFGIESELEIQAVPKRYSYACEAIESFEQVKESLTTTSFVLPRLGTDGINFYGTLSTTHEEDLNELKMHIATKDNSRREVPVGLPSIVTQKIRSVGGIDGYVTHCGGSLIKCINTFTHWSVQERTIHGNGMLQLPQELSSKTYPGYDRNGCHYCFRSRYVFRGLEPSLAGESGLKGNWSTGRHYENVGKLEDTCYWTERPEFKRLEVPSVKKEPLQPQPMPTEPDTLIAFSPSMGVQIGALFAVLVLSCWALVLIKKHCCGQREHRHPTSLSNRADYFPGSNNCEVGNALVDEGAGVNDHHSSFDSGIDRRSVTPPIASSRTTPVLAPTKK